MKKEKDSSLVLRDLVFDKCATLASEHLVLFWGSNLETLDKNVDRFMDKWIAHIEEKIKRKPNWESLMWFGEELRKLMKETCRDMVNDMISKKDSKIPKDWALWLVARAFSKEDITEND